MKLASSKVLSVIAASALILTGCTKKPVRPDPSATMIGPAGGVGDNGINPSQIATVQDNNGLSNRPGDGVGTDGRIPGALGDSGAVYFSFDSSAIKAAERPKLQKAKAYLTSNPQTRLLIEGHCDWRGTAEYNLALGDRRANEAKKYLISLGVSADKLDTVSKGSQEAVKEGGATAWEKDRRDELIVLKAPGA